MSMIANLSRSYPLPSPAYGILGAEKAGQAAQTGVKTTVGADGKALSEDQLRQLESLRSRDREVRAHEAAHQAAAGGLATGGASFSYQRGPDGNLYAIGGEIHIDTSAVPGDPEATLRRAETIMRAALAPADPSGQDRQVAAQAARTAAEARSELVLSKLQKLAGQFRSGQTFGREASAQLDVRA